MLEKLQIQVRSCSSALPPPPSHPFLCTQRLKKSITLKRCRCIGVLEKLGQAKWKKSVLQTILDVREIEKVTQNQTKVKRFDTWFCVIFDYYCASFVLESLPQIFGFNFLKSHPGSNIFTFFNNGTYLDHSMQM